MIADFFATLRLYRHNGASLRHALQMAWLLSRAGRRTR